MPTVMVSCGEASGDLYAGALARALQAQAPATRVIGFGGEIVARLAEENFSALKAAPLRIAALDLPVPFAPELEAAYLPSVEKIIAAIRATMA